MIAEQEYTLRTTLQLADRGLHPHAEWVANGFAAAQERRIAWTREHRHLLE